MPCFNPRTPCGVRRERNRGAHGCRGFNPRTPCGVRPSTRRRACMLTLFQSTHSLRSATRWMIWTWCTHGFQSTHSLRSATHKLQHFWCIQCGFNPRTPCGVRLIISGGPATARKFQSTHSLRSATQRGQPRNNKLKVSIHALLAECDVLKSDKLKPPTSFNPRTPCGVRRISNRAGGLVSQFQSTHSLRSATTYPGCGVADSPVSIHALLAECDYKQQGGRPRLAGFNPRTPCGVRL